MIDMCTWSVAGPKQPRCIHSNFAWPSFAASAGNCSASMQLMNMDGNLTVEGHLVVYYQHGSEQKLMVSRSGDIEVAAYHHSSRLGHSCHSSVDVVHVKGTAEHVRSVFKQLQNTPNVDKVSFISAPMREEDCC